MDKKPIIDWNIILETISDDLTSEDPTNRRCSNGWFAFSRPEHLSLTSIRFLELMDNNWRVKPLYFQTPLSIKYGYKRAWLLMILGSKVDIIPKDGWWLRIWSFTFVHSKLECNCWNN